MVFLFLYLALDKKNQGNNIEKVLHVDSFSLTLYYNNENYCLKTASIQAHNGVNNDAGECTSKCCDRFYQEGGQLWQD
jgi:hypothetical protein